MQVHSHICSTRIHTPSLRKDSNRKQPMWGHPALRQWKELARYLLSTLEMGEVSDLCSAQLSRLKAHLEVTP